MTGFTTPPAPATASERFRGADVAIIGSGPAGLFAAFECGMLRMSAMLIDALPEAGGQCRALYPEKPIYDIPAHPAISGEELITRLEEQIRPFNPTHLSSRRVEQLGGHPGAFILRTDQGEVLRAKAVIIAAGAGAFGPNRPPIPGLCAFEASGAVRYAVQRRDELVGKRIVIAGGGDSAVDWALALADVAASVTLVHRRAKFRAAPDSLARLEALIAQEQIALAVPFQLHGLRGANGKLQAVELAALNGANQLIEADILLPFFGLSSDLGPLARWGLSLDRQQIIVAPSTCETSLNGVYAIGDVATYPGKLKLILQGFAEAAIAAHAAFHVVNPGQALHMQHSTSIGLPFGPSIAA